ncbi:accessory Sec system protein Asp2 [Lactobacillus sp. ESL0791]|uniref:accessory Sec system protein Asp2 n=1 Tax=Lactobacillus sp. ESL0791 TaxID=2983234 RepID=UPI0023F8143B|nr:accessory Sec system protein Asp2 [Lactobacillus sp. ESL0791]MDF7639671.1 accessory Sec system protein Asp2 [Lactobacillus sp. ESL0791]
MNKKRCLFHSGKKALELSDKALTDCTYLWAEPANLASHHLAPVFKDKVFNFDYSFEYFVLDQTSPWLTQPQLLRQLPAHRILYTDDAVVTDEIQEILDFRGAVKIKLGNLLMEINHYFYPINNGGLRGKILSLEIPSEMQNNISYFGNNYIDVTCSFDNWHYLGRLTYSVFVPHDFVTEIALEFKEFEQAELKIEVCCFSVNDTHKLLAKYSKSGADLRASHGKIEVTGLADGYYYSVRYYVRGTGHVHLGTMHQRSSRGKYGLIELGGQSLIDQNYLGGEIAYLFNPGNMKPPLTVYFGGYHTAEAIEGTGILHKKGVPYLLLSDLRVEGGCFYLGDQELEDKIKGLIKDCLAKLHFTVKDLVLSGMSMGTYAAMFYGAQLNPGAIVIAKILLNLGTIAENLRINRPDDFHCASDMVMMLMGDNKLASCQKLDQMLWDTLNQGDFSNTSFMLGYMKNDDYDQLAYSQLMAFLQKNYSHQHVVSKGYSGRHNDDTEAIAGWFTRQLYSVLKKKYGQKF